MKKLQITKQKEFLNAVILGDKSEIDDEMYELYRNNGIAHIHCNKRASYNISCVICL